jgi:hypothetical protein
LGRLFFASFFVVIIRDHFSLEVRFNPGARGLIVLVVLHSSSPFTSLFKICSKEKKVLTRMFHELLSRDGENGHATGQLQGVGPEAYLNGTSQGATPEDARKGGHIRGRSK